MIIVSLHLNVGGSRGWQRQQQRRPDANAKLSIRPNKPEVKWVDYSFAAHFLFSSFATYLALETKPY